MEMIHSYYGDFLILENYMYVKTGKHRDVSYYKCRNNRCKARLAVDINNEVNKRKYAHNHPNVLPEILQLKTKEQIYREYLSGRKESYSRLAEMIDNENYVRNSEMYGEEIANKSRISYRHEEDNLSQRRAEENMMDGEQLPDGSRFLCVKFENDSIVLMFNGKCLQQYEDKEIYFADGTFKGAPKEYTQFYTIHVLVNERVIPLIHVLLKEKSEECYIKMIRLIKKTGKQKTNLA